MENQIDKTISIVKKVDPSRFNCDKCHKQFPLKGNLRQHKITTHGKKTYKCEECKKFWT